jgi:hypothetical protein
MVESLIQNPARDAPAGAVKGATESALVGQNRG